MTQWRLRPGMDRRFRAGHPWVYSNELNASPKGVEPGAPIELSDAGGKFLARGYGNPSSLICFRELSRDEAEKEPWSTRALVTKLESALKVRELAGLANSSFRWCFGEADGIPGLIIERYLLAGSGVAIREPSGEGLRSPTMTQVIVSQAHSAGADRLTPALAEAFEILCSKNETLKSVGWAQTAWVIRNDLGVRKLEGLTEQAPKLERTVAGIDEGKLKSATILVASATAAAPLQFEVDLIEGQKTGFFLDQAGNISQTMRWLTPFAREAARTGKKKLRIVDLCCYVGQWSAQIAAALKQIGIECEIVLVDASQPALDRAKKNAEAAGAQCETRKADVLHDLANWEAASFDIVISDPPALIKNRKDVPQGKHAYLQLHTQVMRLVRSEGLVVCCSCSALLEEEDFLATLAKGASRNQRRVRWIARGSQASDHPALAEFPEGRYLKCWIGVA